MKAGSKIAAKAPLPGRQKGSKLRSAALAAALSAGQVVSGAPIMPSAPVRTVVQGAFDSSGISFPGVSRQQAAAMALERIARLRKEWPSTWSVPNVAQERLLRYLQERPYPKDLIFLAGNGVGKSHLACLIMAGIVWGPRAVCPAGVHPDFGGMRHYEAWSSFRERAARENRPIAGRIIAASDSLKGNGAMAQRIRRLFPKGLWYGEKNGQKYIAEYYCWDRPEDVGNKDLAVAIIDVKTHMQDADQHRGSDLDFIILDEPVPQEVYEECVGRTRANPDAVRIFTITPLEMSGWLIDTLVDGAEGQKVAVVYGSLWDNCRNWHEKPEMWSSGVVGEGRVITRGVLYRAAIVDQIDKWTRMSPDTVKARVYGIPTHLSGSVYKMWNPDVHMVDEIEEPWDDWPIWCIIDPHHARPPATTWIAQGPVTSYVIAEYPHEDYTKMQGAITIDGAPRVTLEDHADVIKMWEFRMGLAESDDGSSDRITQRWGDPNSLKFVYSSREFGGSGLNLQGILYNSGLWFELANDNLRTGHEAVSELLYYDRDKPIGPGNMPKLRVLRTNLATGTPMVNVPNAMTRYGFKKKALQTNQQTSGNLTSIMDQTYKDFADDIRYFAIQVRDEPFQPVSQQRSLVDVIRESRRRSKEGLAEDDDGW